MNPRLAIGLALLAGLVAGFAAGRLSNSGGSSPVPEVRRQLTDLPIEPTTHSSTPPEAAPHSAKTPRPDRQPSGPRVSLPLSVVVESLREKQFQQKGFQSVIYNLPGALTLLGAREDEREAVVGMMNDIKKQILAEEKRCAKVTSVSETELVLDQRGMLEPMKQITKEAQEGIRAHLPKDIADSLIGAIEWDYFYTGGPKEPITTFRIERTPRGMFAQMSYQGGGTGFLLTPDRFPDNGTPISLRDAFFDDRWTPFLGDHKLLPVDDR